jgi:protein-disulfide isomerase
MYAQFESKYKVALNDAEAEIADDLKTDLESSILSTLVAQEAAAEHIDVTDYRAREVTNKMRDFSDAEQYELETALKNRLFAKYRVKILLTEPPPVIQQISEDDDPARGPVNAPVTVVMFSDFQCSACSRTHPILKKVLDEYAGKVRFVVRDFPLRNIHQNAFNAARAANAANVQGKFFEYTEILYRNQDALGDDSLKKYAAQVGLNVAKFALDFTAEKTAAEIQHDISDGEAYGVNGTPTIFINGVKARHLTADAFREAIDAAMKRPATLSAGR